MTVTLGQYGGDQDTGYTDFGDLVSLGYTIYFVSNAGNDTTGDGSFGNPFATIQHVSTITTGFSTFPLNSAVAILMRMGDTFNNDKFQQCKNSGVLGSFSGTRWTNSTTYSGKPIIFGCYDESLWSGSHTVNPKNSSLAHPIITLDNSEPFTQTQGGGAYGGAAGDCLAFVGLDIYLSCHDPNNTNSGGSTTNVAPLYNSAFDNTGVQGLSFLNSITFWLVEDCTIRCTGFGISGGDAPSAFSNVVIRRSRFSQIWQSLSNHAIGFQSNAQTDPLCEECVFDQCGWNNYNNLPDNTDRGFNHSLYYQHDAQNMLVRGNIISRDAAGSQLRGTGTVFDNLFTDGQGDQHNLGDGQTIQDNVYSRALTQTSVIDPGAAVAGKGINAASLVTSSPQTYTRNIFSNIQSGGDFAVAQGECNSAILTNNIVYLWGTTPYLGASTGATLIGGGVRSFDTISQSVAGPANQTYTGKNLTGGSGTSCQVDVHTNGSGFIDSVIVYIEAFGNNVERPGRGYVVGDIVSVASGDIGGISFTCRVADVGVITWAGGNHVFYSGSWQSGVWGSGSPPGMFAPTRTALTYNSERLGGAATIDAFIASAMSNTRQNWTSTKTAAAVNDYIREGMGIIDSTGDGNVILLGQACL